MTVDNGDILQDAALKMIWFPLQLHNTLQQRCAYNFPSKIASFYFQNRRQRLLCCIKKIIIESIIHIRRNK